MISRVFIIILSSVFILSCGKGVKQQEYVDDKPATQKEEEKKQDTTSKQIEETAKDTESSKDKFEYKRSENPVAVISPLDASEYMGKFVTVKGLVADVYRSDKVAYLNFIKKFPDNPFSGVVFAREFDAFGDLNVYQNKNVEISGRISTYRGKPQMILNKPSQIKIVN